MKIFAAEALEHPYRYLTSNPTPAVLAVSYTTILEKITYEGGYGGDRPACIRL
jgi:hypothetical protein